MRGRMGRNVGHGRHMGHFGMRYWILALLSDGEKTGSDIMHLLEQNSMGAWRPSPGTVYPALKQLQEDGYIKGEEKENKKFYSLTKSGEELCKAYGIRREKPVGESSDMDDVFSAMESYADYLYDMREELLSKADLTEKLQKLREKLSKIN